MEQGTIDESISRDTPNKMLIREFDENDLASEVGATQIGAYDDSANRNGIFNENEEEIHLDYDGLSDDNCDDTLNCSKKNMIENSNETTNVNEEEIRLDYDGVSDDNLNYSNNSNKEENSLNPNGNCEETPDANEEYRLDPDDNEEKSSLEHDDKKEKSSLVSSDNEKKSSLELDEISLDHDSVTDKKHHDRSAKIDKQAIQSQQQRLQREAQFSIPYHKPKKHTLQEFLSRRTIMKPSESVEENFGFDTLGKSRNLKMTKEELEIYSKLMEDRAKEASEFFKSEDLKDSNETTVIENNDTQIKCNDENMQVNIDFEQKKSSEVIDNKECEERSTSNVIITEVLELPKIDLKNVATELNLKEIVQQSLSPQAKTVLSLESNKGISNILKTSPVLNKNVDITIDLFSNERETSKPISRANSLLERLMKTNNYKPKPKNDRGLLSPNCNSKSFIEKSEPGLNKKPGETFLQLKDNLKSLIMKKRREEMMKKQEEDNDKKKLEFDTDLDELSAIDDEELDEEVESTSSENSDSESTVDSAHDSGDENDDNDPSVDESQKIPAAQAELQSNIAQRIRLSFDIDDEPQSLNRSAISQIPATQITNREEEADQLINLCSGTFQTQPVAVTEHEVVDNKIISSDEENFQLSSSKKSRSKRLTKKIKKSKMKLGFSDDEDDEDDNKSDKCEATDVGNDENVLADDNLPATYIDYDSEENEIMVELTKQDCLKHAEKFVEKEAELSDSEWGSADEDEKNLDQYDIELGDEDEFDKEEVRAELEKIHARKMLDEDIRQVNKLQEILFEDEEDESAKRQRKFRWKNFDTAFNIDISQNELKDLKPEDGSDDENEHIWRKIRYEREQAIKNHSLNEISLEASSSITTPDASSDIRNVTIVTTSTKTKISGSEEKEKSPFLISKELIKSENLKARSSFLLRNKKALTKTIYSVKSGSSDVNTSPDKIGIKAINPSKFVFTTLSLEEHETLKRKADDANGGIDIKISKRLKSETRKSEYLIDKLL